MISPTDARDLAVALRAMATSNEHVHREGCFRYDRGCAMRRAAGVLDEIADGGGASSDASQGVTDPSAATDLDRTVAPVSVEDTVVIW